MAAAELARAHDPSHSPAPAAQQEASGRAAAGRGSQLRGQRQRAGGGGLSSAGARVHPHPQHALPRCGAAGGRGWLAFGQAACRQQAHQQSTPLPLLTYPQAPHHSSHSHAPPAQGIQPRRPARWRTPPLPAAACRPAGCGHRRRPAQTPSRGLRRRAEAGSKQLYRTCREPGCVQPPALTRPSGEQKHPWRLTRALQVAGAGLDAALRQRSQAVRAAVRKGAPGAAGRVVPHRQLAAQHRHRGGLVT